MTHTRHRLSALLLVAAVLHACGDDGDDMINENDNQEPAGDPAVGFVELDISYVPDGLPSDEDARTIQLRVWYPATTDGTDASATYQVAGIVEVETEVALDSPPPAAGVHPVAVYSHGSGGDGLLGYPFGEAFAQNGWILLSASHTGNTALDGVNGTLEPFSRVALFRPQDVSAALDWLDEESAQALVGEGDTSRAFVTGHSFGGATTFSVAGADLDYDVLNADCDGAGAGTDDCEFLALPEVQAAYAAGTGDSRVVASAPQAPALISIYGDGELEAIDTPVMLMSGRLDQTTTQASSADPAWAALNSSGNIWVDLPTGAHFTFVTICDDLPANIRLFFQPDSNEDGCGPEFIPSADAVPQIGEYLLAFARWHVLGETAEAALFDQSIEGFVVTQP